MASKRGRKLKLNAELIQEFDSVLTMGAYFKDACAQCGIHEDTAYNWIRLAEAEAKRMEDPPDDRVPQDPAYKPIMSEFADMVVQRSAKVKNMVLGSLVIAAQKDWRAGAWFLEHRYPKDFGTTVRAEVSGEGLTTSHVIIGIVEQIRKQVLKAEPERPGVLLAANPDDVVDHVEEETDMFEDLA